jgi:tRNA-Thr(GGU) m(6)t(6)A37 methyltransferase TsaA
VYVLRPVGRVVSSLTDRAHAPKQGFEGAPPAWLEFDARFEDALRDLRPGQEVLVITWLHLADRETLRVHPRDRPDAPLTGVFSTRSQDRPNPIGIHRVTIARTDGPTRLEVLHLEAFDGTPVIDVKPVLDAVPER